MSCCIIDSGVGNLSSIKNSISNFYESVYISSNHKDIINASHLILPGVGSFKSGMRNLESMNLIDLLNEQVLTKKKPILGICLGMQLFASYGFENGKTKGLSWIKGTVEKIKIDENLRLPHVGWNDIDLSKKSLLLHGCEEELVFYFVHSYEFLPSNSNETVGTTDYGKKIVCILEKDNIFATQFHPEKSHVAGSIILKNFLKI